MSKEFQLTLPLARKVLDTVDAGLTGGLGRPVPGQMCVEAAVCYALGLPHSDDPKCVSRAVRSLKITLNDSHWSSKAARADGMRALAVLQLGTSVNFDERLFVEKVTLFVTNVIVADLFETLTSVEDHVKHAAALRSAKTLADVRIAANAAANAAYSAAYSAANAAYSAAYSAANAAAYAAYSAYFAANAAYFAANAANAAAYAAYSAYFAANAANAAAYAAASASKHDSVLKWFAKGVAQILVDMEVPAVGLLSKLDIEV